MKEQNRIAITLTLDRNGTGITFLFTDKTNFVLMMPEGTCTLLPDTALRALCRVMDSTSVGTPLKITLCAVILYFTAMNAGKPSNDVFPLNTAVFKVGSEYRVTFIDNVRLSKLRI